MSEYTSADVIKSMKMFFIDNQGSWPAHKDGTCKAELAGDLVIYPDSGRYPNYVPIAAATHPNFDGLIVVQAGTRGLLVSFISGAKASDDINKRLKSMEGVEQYRVAVDAIVHRMVLHFAQQNKGTVTSEVDPLSLMAWMAASDKGQDAARVIAVAVQALMAHPETLQATTRVLQEDDPKADAFTLCDGILSTIQQTIAAQATQGSVAPVQRRK